MSKKILLITEKKDQAVKLSAAIGLSEKNNCWIGKLNGDDLTVVCASGHLLEMLSPGEVNPELTWNDPKMLVPIPRDYRKKVKEGRAQNYLNNIKFHLNGKDEVIIGTDSDREGEAIGWSILQFLGWKGKTKRAWFAAGLDKKSMNSAVNNLREPNITYGYAVAAEARGRSDWPYMHLVRAYSFYSQHNCFGPNLGRGTGKGAATSVGRVQTPTLGMIVKREEEIENFVAKTHYKLSGLFIPVGDSVSINSSYAPEVSLDVINSNPSGVTWEPTKKVTKDGDPEPLDTPLFTGKKEVDEFIDRLNSSANNASVLSYQESSTKESPPKTFDLPNAVSTLTSSLKVSTSLAQTILEDLYEQGWTSYARTSKSDLPSSLYANEARNEMFDSLSYLPEVNTQAKFAQSIHNGKNERYGKFKPSVFSDKDMEHFGIVPTAQVMTKERFDNLSPRKADGSTVKHTREHMQNAYLIIAKQFVRVMYPPAVYAVQDIKFQVPVQDLLGHSSSVFKSKASRLIDPGWRSAFGDNAEKDNSVSPQIPGNRAILDSLKKEEAVTSPPKRYTEKNLQTSMANIGRTVSDPKLRKLLLNSEGIGTPATRKQIIQTLLDRGYIELKKSTYYPTLKGRDLIKIVPDWLSNPATTAMWEDYLVKIEEEKDARKAHQMRDDFVSKQVKMVEDLIDHLNSNLFDTKGERVQSGPTTVSAKMKNLIKLISTKKGIEIPKGALTNPQKAKEFLDQNIQKRDPNLIYPPSEKQKEFLQTIIDGLPDVIKVPDDVWTDSKATSKFIDENKSQMPPSPGQISFAKKLIEKLPNGETAPEGVFDSGVICSKFIESQTKDWGKKGSASGNKKTAYKKSAVKK